MLHMNIIMLHVNIIKSHVNIIMLHVDINSIAFRGEGAEVCHHMNMIIVPFCVMTIIVSLPV